MSPYQFFLNVGVHMERPYTGEYWDLRDHGHYQCSTCTQRLFMSDHKYNTKYGHAMFWSHIVNAVSY